MIKCLHCGKEIDRRCRKHKTEDGETYNVINPFCSEECKIECYKDLYLHIGYEDGYEDAFKIAIKEMELNIEETKSDLKQSMIS